MSSVWEISNMPEFDSLKEDAKADVCIVGGGIAGIWAAYLLSKAGKSVVLIESDKIGRAATLYTTAFVTESLDTSYDELTKMFGEEASKLIERSNQEAIVIIDRAIKDEGIDCEWTRLPVKIFKNMKDFKGTPDEEFANQGKYHPMKFLKGLAEAAVKNGAKIYESTEAGEIKSGDSVTVMTKSGHSITVSDVIVATYEPWNNPKPTHFKKGMYVSYVMALELPKGALDEGLYLDQHNPYHYVRIDDLGEKMRMIVGGEDHRAEISFEDKQSFDALKQFIEKTFPNLPHKVTNKWQGGILESSDGLALIGEYAPHEYVAAAFSGNGMTYAAISARIITDLITSNGSDYKEVYDPKRALKTGALMHKFKDYAGEFFGGAVKNLFK